MAVIPAQQITKPTPLNILITPAVKNIQEVINRSKNMLVIIETSRNNSVQRSLKKKKKKKMDLGQLEQNCTLSVHNSNAATLI